MVRYLLRVPLVSSCFLLLLLLVVVVEGGGVGGGGVCVAGVGAVACSL
jgi:hypothetical protein